MAKEAIQRELIKEIPITSYLIDLRGNLSIPSLFSLFQEVAWEHSTMDGFGFNQLQQQGLFWVLSRVYVEIYQMPQWTDNIKLTTWHSGTDGVFALRDFIVHNREGRKLISATSSWLVVDIETRRPKRPQSIKMSFSEDNPKRALNINPQKVNKISDEDFSSYAVTSRLSDIDINGHINNTKYIEWVVNSFSADLYAEHLVKSLQINFLSEGFLNETFSIKVVHTAKNHFLSEIIREEDEKRMFAVEIVTKRG